MKISASKNKVMAFTRKQHESINFAKPYRMRKEGVLNCVINMEGE